MNPSVKNIGAADKIFGPDDKNFTPLALEIFRFQYEQNPVYRQYCDLLQVNPDNVTAITQIPFLPIGFFKHTVLKTGSWGNDVTFTSSGTSGQVSSQHHIPDLSFY